MSDGRSDRTNIGENRMPSRLGQIIKAIAIYNCVLAIIFVIVPELRDAHVIFSILATTLWFFASFVQEY